MASPNPGSIDRAQKVYQAINLKEAAKKGNGSSKPGQIESGTVRMIEKPDYSSVGGGPINANSEASESGSRQRPSPK